MIERLSMTGVDELMQIGINPFYVWPAVWVGNVSDTETLLSVGLAGAGIGIEPVRRRTLLSWSHHQEVAGMPPDQQDEWLDKAEQDNRYGYLDRERRCFRI